MRPGQAKLSPERHARILKAVELKLKGKSYRAIADELGVSISVAFDDVQHHFGELDKLAKEQLEEHRKVELARIDKLLEKLFTITERSPVADEEGVFNDVDGTAVKAIVAAAKLMERRAKLLGLDAPVKHQEVPAEGADMTVLVKSILADEKVRREVLEQLKGEPKEELH